MAEILKQLDVRGLPLTSGDNKITVTALSTGLDESSQSAAVVYSEGELEFTLSPQGDYYIVSGIGNLSLPNVIIPDKYESIPVKAIGNRAFMNKRTITSVVIPASITSIGEMAFYSTTIASVTFEKDSNLIEIGASAFKDCTYLTTINIPANVALICESAFAGCTSINSINFESANWATVYFRNNKKWTDIKCNTWITGQLGGTNAQMTFVENDGEYDIFSATVPFVDDSSMNINVTFAGYLDSKVVVSQTVSSFPQSKGGSLFTPIYTGCCWEIAEDLRTLIPIIDFVPPLSGPGLTIGEYAFAGLEFMYNMLSIPDNVVSIGDYAFYNCLHLTGVTIGLGVRHIGESAFEYCSQIQRVIFGRQVWQVTDDGSNAPRQIPILTKVLYEIGEKAFSLGITEDQFTLTIPSCVKKIGASAFAPAGILKAVGFKNIYGWFYSQDEGLTGGNAISPANLSDDLVAGAYLSDTYSGYHWYKLDQMPAPTVTLDGVMLSITDSTGIAESFNIYVGGKMRATVYADE